MSNNILLAPLIELENPVTISMLPETIGWKVLGMLLLCLLLVMSYRKYSTWKKNYYRRHALQQLSSIDFSKKSTAAFTLNCIMKEVASITFGAPQVANLYGEKWLEFLSSSSELAFDCPQAIYWQGALYDTSKVEKMNCDDFQTLQLLCKNWVVQHEVVI